MKGYLTTSEVAESTGIPAATLRYWRSIGKGPRSFNMGRNVYYSPADVEGWVNQQIESTARGDMPATA